MMRKVDDFLLRSRST